MATSKDDIKYATSQARMTEDEAVRVAYKHGTPIEGGFVAESQPVDLFKSAAAVGGDTGNIGQQPNSGGEDVISSRQIERGEDQAVNTNARTTT